MTVTQMSEHLGVGKAYLYRFIPQMVREGLISKPEAQVKDNYVEKYYRLIWKPFASMNTLEQKTKLRSLPAAEQKKILESFLATLGLQFRLLAEEMAKASPVMTEDVGRSFQEGRVILSYLVLPDEIYDRLVKDVSSVVRGVTEDWGRPSFGSAGNKLVIVGIPKLADTK